MTIPKITLGTLGGRKRACFACLLCAAAAIASPGQTFQTLVNFDGSNGANPSYMSLVQGTDGYLYGTTPSGGMNGGGTVLKMSVTGTLTTLYSFCSQGTCPDGTSPESELLLADDGNFYGTSSGGGANGYGTIFKITRAGTLTTL